MTELYLFPSCYMHDASSYRSTLASFPFGDDDNTKSLLDMDSQGRCLISDHIAFVLFNVYFPASNDEIEGRTEFKKEFHLQIERRWNSLRLSGRKVIIVGDFNACYQQIDSAYWMEAKVE